MLDIYNIYICIIMEIKIKFKMFYFCVLMWCCIKSFRCVLFYWVDLLWIELDFNF